MKIRKNKIFTLFDYDPKEGMIYAKVRDGIIHFYHCHDYWGEKYGESLWIETGFIDCRIIYRSKIESSNNINQHIGYPYCSELLLNNNGGVQLGFIGSSNSFHDYCYMLLKKTDGTVSIMEMVSKNIILDNIDYECKLILRSKDDSSANRFCYMVFKDSRGKGYIMEIFSKNIILRDVNYNDIRSIKKRVVSFDEYLYNDEKSEDAVLTIWDKNKKQYSLYSIRKGYIFGPTNYNEIEEYLCGVIIDEHIAVENDGYIFDFSNYEEDCGIYYNKEKDDYKILLDSEDGIFFTMEEDEWNQDIVKYRYENEYGTVIYKFNKETGEQHKEFEREDEGYQWTERDSWDALTDGQYGEYPEDGLGWDTLDDYMGL